MGEASSRAHGERTEHDGGGEGSQAHVAGWDITLDGLDDGRGGEGDDGRGEGCGLGDFHWLLLIYREWIEYCYAAHGARSTPERENAPTSRHVAERLGR